MTDTDKTPSPQDPSSPCINLCVKDVEEDVCLGCGRTTGEIEEWASLSAQQQEIIIKQGDQRLDALTNKRRKKRITRHREKAGLKNA